jgi:glycosyltransferase involved in cell wall biosynthesis
MRIGMMVDMYKPHISGVTNYVSLNKRWLEGLGHKVFVFTFGDVDYEDDELYVVHSPGMPLNVLDSGVHVSFRYSLAAQRKIQSMDLVHVHHPFLSGTLALRYCKSRGIPVVFTNHTRYDLYAQHYLPHVPEFVGDAFLQAYLPAFCQRCDLVVAPSPSIVGVMRDIGVTRDISVIPNGIDLTPFRGTAGILSRQAAGLPADKTVLMYLGRVSPEKNLAFLLRAFFGVAAAVPDVVLAIVGDGSEADNLRDQARHAGLAERVLFLGQVAYEQVPDYLKLADVFVTASETEVHPLSLIEAMAAGLPVLGVNAPGVGDTITDGDDGLLSTNDLAGFTAKLMRLVLEPDLRRRLGARALVTAERYSIDRTAQQMLAEYERLAVNSVRRVRGWAGLQQRLRRWLPGP